MDSKKYVLFVYTLITLTILDIITTHYAINYFGLSEGNPIMDMIVSSLPLFIMVKIVAVLFIIGLYRMLLLKNERIASIGKNIIIGMMVLVVSSNMIHIASAESGNITVTDFRDSAWTLSSTSSGATSNWTKIYFDVSDYNDIDYIEVAGATAFSFSQAANSTTFTCNSPNICSGFSWYNANTSRMYWVFTSSTISQSPIILSYNSNIYSGVTYGNSHNTQTCSTPGIVSSTQPICFENTNTFHNALNFISVETNAIFTDVYDITYSNGYFTTNLFKNQNVNTKYFINSYPGTEEYFREASFNKVNFSSTNLYNNGISLNTTLASGTYHVTLINSSGCSVCVVPTPAAQPTLDTTGYQIVWWTDTFIVDTANNFSVRVNDPDTLNLYNYNVLVHNSQNDEIFRDDDILKEEQLDYSVVLSTYGTYVVYLQRCFLFVCTTVAQDRIDPTDDLGISTITMNSTQFMRVPFNVTITLGYTPVYANMIALIIYDRNGIVVDADYTVHENGDISNFDKTYPPGSYTIKLHDIQKNVILASRTFTVIQVPGQVPVQNITQNYITLDGTFFVLGEYSYLRWSINDSLWQNRTMYYENYNYNISEVTARDSLIEQREFQQVSFSYMTDTSCSLGALCYYRAGNNQMRLVAKNVTDSTTEIISFWNYTLATTTSSGWGLILPAEVKVDEVFTLEAIVPAGQLRANIYIYDPIIGNTTKYFSVFQGAGTSTYRLKISRGGFYDVVMLDDNRDAQFRQALHVGDNGTGGTTGINAPGAGQAGSDGISPTDSLDTYVRALKMGLNPTSKLLFSIILIIIFGIAALWFSKGQGNIAALVMFAPYAFFLYVDYIPKWTFVIVVILIGISTRLFR